MAQQTVNTSGGVSLPTVLFVVFLILKLTDVIDWSWWWVFAPLWIPLAILFVGAFIAAMIAVASRPSHPRRR